MNLLTCVRWSTIFPPLRALACVPGTYRHGRFNFRKGGPHPTHLNLPNRVPEFPDKADGC